MKGNEAIAHAAIRCGCDGYFGYPITPQSEVLETLAVEKPWETTGMVVLQAESEVSSINMVYGGACTGKRVMTSSSSPGISLMQEGLSYMAGAELPALIVDVMRGGPGLGTIQPSQADYFQAFAEARTWSGLENVPATYPHNTATHIDAAKATAANTLRMPLVFFPFRPVSPQPEISSKGFSVSPFSTGRFPQPFQTSARMSGPLPATSFPDSHCLKTETVSGECSSRVNFPMIFLSAALFINQLF